MLRNLFLLAFAANAFAAQLETFNFTTQLDHFRPQDDRTVDLTYAANFEHYEAGGPFYVYIKDVFDRSTRWIESGLMVDIAKNTSGALFTYDPRFFGENIPVESAQLDSMQYLTPEQALQDLATFVETVRERNSETAKVIVWGSGYGGTLATWARKKFPHLIDAAWSSSGVFEMHIATLGLYDSLAYTLHRVAGIGCRNRVQAALDELDARATAGDSNLIREQLHLCGVGDLNDPQETGLLFESYLRFIVEYIEENHTRGVQQFCEAMETPADRPLQALGRWVHHVYHAGAERCRDLSYANLVAAARSEQWNVTETHASLRQATYLQCTQTGLFQITDNVTWIPHRLPLSYHERKCSDILGERFNFRMLQQANAAIARTYGSLYQSVTNVLYTNGMIDPWFTHGIVYSHDPRTLVLNIEHHARSADLTSIRSGEPSALGEAKRLIVQTITQWS